MNRVNTYNYLGFRIHLLVIMCQKMLFIYNIKIDPIFLLTIRNYESYMKNCLWWGFYLGGDPLGDLGKDLGDCLQGCLPSYLGNCLGNNVGSNLGDNLESNLGTDLR